MNRVTKHLPPFDAIAKIENAALQRGFERGRDYEREKLRAEWCADITQAYEAGVADSQQIARQGFWLGVVVGVLYAVIVGGVVAGFVWGVMGLQNTGGP
jgi:predicted DNA repair protein MutK